MTDMPEVPPWALEEDDGLKSLEGDLLDSLKEADVVQERAVLGCILHDPQCWPQVEPLITPSAFIRPEHKEIWQALSEMVLMRKTIDCVTVMAHLKERGKLELAGGLAYLTRLERDCPTAANAGQYANLVQDSWQKRRLHEDIARELSPESMRGQTAAQVLQHLEEISAALKADIEASANVRPKPQAIRWTVLKDKQPPPREWAIEHWLGMGHVTLMAGPGGLGKTLIAQTLATCMALGRGFLERCPQPRRVLMLAGEDDHDELWRRQLAICQWLGEPIEAIPEDRMMLLSYKGHDMSLAEQTGARLVETAFLAELAQMIRDYQADYLILDSVARTFGGNESDRHHVTQFVTWLEGICGPAGCLLLAHPSKAAGAEYSGSTAWEASVRGRLYLGYNPPDEAPPKKDEEPPPIDENVRYLARRKANYSARDCRKLIYRNGVYVPEFVESVGGIAAPSFSQRYALAAKAPKKTAAETEAAVLVAVQKLADMGKWGSAAHSSQYAVAKRWDLAGMGGGFDPREINRAVDRLLGAGRIKEVVVAKRANRSGDLVGLVVAGPEH